MLRGVVHDPTARRMGGVAGHAGLFSTAADLAHLLPHAARRRRVSAARASCRRSTVAKMTTPATPAGEAERARPRLGHRLVVLVQPRRAAADRLVRPHRLHRHVALDRSGDAGCSSSSCRTACIPDGKGDVTPLRARVATVAASALTSLPPAAARGRSGRGRDFGAVRRRAAAGAPRAGADRHRRAARATASRRCAGKRVGLVTNHTGRARDGATTIDLLARRQGREARRALQPRARHPRHARRRRSPSSTRREDRAADPLALRRDAAADGGDARRARRARHRPAGHRRALLHLHDDDGAT